MEHLTNSAHLAGPIRSERLRAPIAIQWLCQAGRAPLSPRETADGHCTYMWIGLSSLALCINRSTAATGETHFEQAIGADISDPVYMSRKIRSFERINSIRETNGNFDSCNSVNGWFPAVYMSCMSQNFRLFHVSNLSVRNFRIFLLMYTGSPTGVERDGRGRSAGHPR